MADHLQFDLTDPNQCPILTGLAKYLDEFTPHTELASYYAKPMEEDEKNLKGAIAVIKRKMFEMMFFEHKSFKKLIHERDRLEINIQDKEQREIIIKKYNKYVIENVEIYCNALQGVLATVFGQDFNESKRKELNLSSFFKNWYEKFGPKDENEKIELLPPAGAEGNKIKWMGTPSQFGFIIDLLIQGRYIKKPTSSFDKDAKYFLEIFDINTTHGTLARELSETTNSLDTRNRKKFTIPPKSELIS